MLYVFLSKNELEVGFTTVIKLIFDNTVRPRGTRPHGTRTSLGHDFKKGSKILAGHDFGT